MQLAVYGERELNTDDTGKELNTDDTPACRQTGMTRIFGIAVYWFVSALILDNGICLLFYRTLMIRRMD